MWTTTVRSLRAVRCVRSENCRPWARAVLIGATIAGVVVGPAAAVARVRDVPFRVTGALTVTWKGNQAGGCARVGVCTQMGSLVYEVAVSGVVALRGTGRSFSADVSRVRGNPDDSATVRVTRSDGQSAALAACSDRVSVDATTLLEFGATSPRRIGLAVTDLSPLSGGRCGGPLPNDLRRALPFATFPTSAFAKHSAKFRLVRARAFAHGPFAGEITPDLTITIGRPRRHRVAPHSGIVFERGPRKGPPAAVLELDYELTKLSGALAADFRASPDAACQLLDACAAGGTSTYSFAASTGFFFLNGYRRTDRRHTSVARELRAVERGRYGLSGFGFIQSGPKPLVSETLQRGGVEQCSDSVGQDFPTLAPEADSDGLRIVLVQPTNGFSSQPFTHCAGPLWSDVFGQKELAAASAPIRALRQSHVRLTATRPGGFAGKSYSGARRGEVALGFRLVSAKARVTTKRPLP